jgi:hypothetical protein
MTCSFPLVLVITVLVIRPDLVRPTTTSGSRTSSQTVEDRPRRRPAPVRRPLHTAPERLGASQVRPALVAPEASRSASPVTPDPTVIRDLAALRQDLTQQRAGLARDRDALLAALSQALAGMPAASAARELAALDDDSVLQTLRPLAPGLRRQILDQLPGERAQRLQRLLPADAPG